MKYIISENQYLNLIEGIFLSDDEKKNRLEISMELAKKYKNPRQFALENKRLWNFIRTENLVDVVFPNTLKKKPEGYWTIDKIGQESMKYNTRMEFHDGNQVAYEKARSLGILDALFPYTNRGRPRKN
jgi:hypothetical protein